MPLASSFALACVLGAACAAPDDGPGGSPPPPSWAGTWRSADQGDTSNPDATTTTTTTTTTTMTLRAANDDGDTIGGNGSRKTGDDGAPRTFVVSGNAGDDNLIEFIFDGPAAAAAFVAGTERYAFVQVSDDMLILVLKSDVKIIHVFTRVDDAAQGLRAPPPQGDVHAAFDSNGDARL